MFDEGIGAFSPPPASGEEEDERRISKYGGEETRAYAANILVE